MPGCILTGSINPFLLPSDGTTVFGHSMQAVFFCITAPAKWPKWLGITVHTHPQTIVD